jgi:hypothetical protein
MNFSSEGSPNSSLCQQLIRTEAGDSGVDLSESGLTNSVQNLLSSQHTTIGRSHSANLASTNEQDNQSNHQFVIKTSSSPTPEQSVSNRSSFVPLTGVLSAPAPSIHSHYGDSRPQNSIHQQIRPILTRSDEDDEDSQIQQNFMTNNSQILPKSMDKFCPDVNSMDHNNRLRQFSSLRNRNTRNNLNNTLNNSESVSQYLGVDAISGSVRNTFIQPNSGMRGKYFLLSFSFLICFLSFI